MASIRKRALADGATAYIVRWVDPAGAEQTRQFSKATGSRPAEAAKDFKTRIEDELRRGTYVDPRAGQITVRTYVEQTEASQIHLRENTRRRNETNLRVHVLPLIGDMRIGGVRRQEIQWMVNTLATTAARGTSPPRALAPSTVRSIYQLVAGVFRSAVLDGVIQASPCARITLPTKPRTEVLIPTPEQVGVIADAVPPRYRALILFAAGSGLRSAELRGLDLDRLRLLDRTVRVDRQLLDPRGGRPIVFGPPKTPAAHRTVPISSSYVEVVAEHLAEFGTGEHDLVFTSVTGRALRRQVLGEALRPVLRDLGFPERSGMHIFRHYYVSGLIAYGVDVQTVMRLVGHESPRETLDTYGHLWPGHEDRTREATTAAFPMGRRDRSETTKTIAGPSRGVRQVTPISRPGR